MYVLGYFFSIYCGYKMFMATINFIFSRDPNQDPVTKFLSIAVDTLSSLSFELLFYVCGRYCEVKFAFERDHGRPSMASSKLMWRSGRSRFRSFSSESSCSSPFAAFCSTPFDSFDKSPRHCRPRYLDCAYSDRTVVVGLTLSFFL